MKTKLALIGFGTVGQGLCDILLSKKEYLHKKYNFAWDIVAISTLKKGSLYSPDGLDVKSVLNLINQNQSIEKYHHSGSVNKGLNALETIAKCNADIVCEMTYTDIQTGQPAADHCREALRSGKHVVTSNKGPAALFYHELTRLAEKNRLRFLIEGTVMSGTPVLNLARDELAGNYITSIRGILNETTNFILTGMEEGHSYRDVLQEARKLGYAEANPTADVEGFDALAKVIILANVVMDEQILPEQIPCRGITTITPEDISAAKKEGKRWKLIGEVKKQGDHVTASVKPVQIDLSHPLASVKSAMNAITFTTDLMGDITVVGTGAGKTETGFSILSDILEIHRQKKDKSS